MGKTVGASQMKGSKSKGLSSWSMMPQTKDVIVQTPNCRQFMLSWSNQACPQAEDIVEVHNVACVIGSIRPRSFHDCSAFSEASVMRVQSKSYLRRSHMEHLLSIEEMS